MQNKSQEHAKQDKLLKTAKSMFKSLEFSLEASDIMKLAKSTTPTITQQQVCQDVLSGINYENDLALYNETQLAVKLSFIAYCFPYFFPEVSTRFHLSNTKFMKTMEHLVFQPNTMQHAFQQMHDIVKGSVQEIVLPNDNQFAGFYIRTPIQIWDAHHNDKVKGGSLKPIYKIPKIKDKNKMLEKGYTIRGNINAYVLRNHLVSDPKTDANKRKYECHVTFRGSSSAFNTLPLFGIKFDKTQVFQIPTYDPLTHKNYKNGSSKHALFFKFYIDSVNQIKQHIYQCLEWLDAMNDDCSRIIVCGHSLGSALSLAFCYLMYYERPDLWQKCHFRSVATPLCCNSVATAKMESWMIESKQTNKYIEIVNNDDFVNVQLFLGGYHGLEKSIHSGHKRFMIWLISQYYKTHGIKGLHGDIETNDRIFRIIQQYPDVALATFIHGAFDAQRQHAIENKQKSSKRMGSNKEKEYDKTVRAVFCERRVDYETEFLGKSHASYVDLNMTLFWLNDRKFEDQIYEYYHEHDLKTNNELRIVPMFGRNDLPFARSAVQKYLSQQ